MATNKPQADYQKQGVRIPKDLHARIHEAAVASGRSYNSELISRLEASFVNAATSHGVMPPMGGGGSSLRSELVDAAAQINDLQGKRNTVALLMTVLRTSGQDAELERLRRDMDDLDLEIARLVQFIQSRSASTEGARPAAVVGLSDLVDGAEVKTPNDLVDRVSRVLNPMVRRKK
ncbi:Arc family DNA-binding protein [Acidovorax sp. HMWF018]|uniref:Arc family DNA-binding protein n=1 Tax=Acidovorax sp. HMWF018 TaxID=2056855 RepID=UPI001304B5BC|nr:Arc family DNA-binding protein [Acidovorax sp. HMWF018]